MSKTTLDQILKDNKLSFTQQRRVILEEVYNADTHLTADEIYFKVKKRMAKVSVGTIYRNLNVLVSLSFIDKVDTSLHGESYYEASKDPHYHIICTNCLKIIDLEHYRALSIEPTAAKISGYKVKHHLVELHGVCPKCAPQENMHNTPEIKIPTITPMTTIPKKPIEQKPQQNVNKQYTKPQQTNQPQKTQSQRPPQQNNQPNTNQQYSNTKKSFSNKHSKRKFFFGRRNQND